ncbi:hypothetical protein DPMN_030812 [Dreissena polymorpha]|uniref:Uncharacterized protein n=1 Tax=Dreissena polymorpha TaxID=45954 RepID=A0A9D4LYU2_DREPO|nr:hypothetical protein DPMN_030812 [Dreissena polymorpha]
MSAPSGQKRRIRKEPDVTSGSSSSTSAIVVEDSDDTEADTEVRACPSTSAQGIAEMMDIDDSGSDSEDDNLEMSEDLVSNLCDINHE